nr:DUF3054 domain-containing protein [Actinomycetales bacterium]
MSTPGPPGPAGPPGTAGPRGTRDIPASSPSPLEPSLEKDDIPAITADLVLVFAFATIGRMQHAEPLTIADLAYTALPFWVGALIGHVILRFARKNPRSLPWGGFLVVSTWTLGHAGRLMLDQGSDPAFLAVSAAFLALFLLGWRLVLTLVVRRRRQYRP